ncbi:MAG: hypothetical protein ACR2O3_01710 [Rhizobiaceae bacterium]
MKNILKVAMVAGFAAVPMHANAVTGDVQFNGTVTHTCVINVGRQGTMVADAAFQNLDSTNAGGQSGQAQIVATGNGFDVSIDVPAAFGTEPAADATAETFSGAYTTSGATVTSGSAVGGANSGAQNLSNGTTDVDINLAAAKAGADVFEAGNYVATVVLRCE